MVLTSDSCAGSLKVLWRRRRSVAYEAACTWQTAVLLINHSDGRVCRRCILPYSDVSAEYVLDVASRVLVAGADFLMLAPTETFLQSTKPVKLGSPPSTSIFHLWLDTCACCHLDVAHWQCPTELAVTSASDASVCAGAGGGCDGCADRVRQIAGFCLRQQSSVRASHPDDCGSAPNALWWATGSNAGLLGRPRTVISTWASPALPHKV